MADYHHEPLKSVQVKLSQEWCNAGLQPSLAETEKPRLCAYLPNMRVGERLVVKVTRSSIAVLCCFLVRRSALRGGIQALR
jgi:hypothetical protein